MPPERVQHAAPQPGRTVFDAIPMDAVRALRNVVQIGLADQRAQRRLIEAARASVRCRGLHWPVSIISENQPSMPLRSM